MYAIRRHRYTNFEFMNFTNLFHNGQPDAYGLAALVAFFKSLEQFECWRIGFNTRVFNDQRVLCK